MSLILSGSNGLSDVDGTAATPAIRGTDANTGIFFPAADTIAFAEGGAEVMRIDSSGNVGIGTSSPSYRIDAVGTGTASTGILRTSSNLTNSTTKYGYYTVGHYTNATAPFGFIQGESNSTENNVHIGGGAGEVTAATRIDFYTAANNTTTNGTERMRIDSEGDLLINTTSTNNNEKVRIKNGNDARAIAFQSASAAECGYIYINAGGTSTTYSTSSDYRLKENIAPMTGALAKVQALKPVTYKWKINGFDGQGFIAHELQEVVPDCVTGVKDAVQTYTDEEGNEATRPVYQGIDTSFLVATLTAAIQEQQSLITALTARITALEAK
jgi:hypothetical protein